MQPIARALTNCNMCPRQCGVNRTKGELGYCNTGSKPLVASITIHKGEEPALSGSRGICNVFFAHCNLSCCFCQNHQISRNTKQSDQWLSDYEVITQRIIEILDQGITILGFVSPTHQIPQMVIIIEKLNLLGYRPRIVYNTNCYDSPNTLRLISDYVDIYLPDIKYIDNALASKYSDAPSYSYHAVKALREMLWQKGTSLTIDKNGIVEQGVIVRHLVLPGHTTDSIRVIRELNEISNRITISLMSQFTPSSDESNCISRTLTPKEYETVIKEMESLGFHRGWIQNMESNSYYLPNFSKKNPFKE
ncbi:MAG: hypothetical protein PHT92_05350 [Bacteroidales bacterium]|nr:hypothetical protein [Bacteroidales bacterium]